MRSTACLLACILLVLSACGGGSSGGVTTGVGVAKAEVLVLDLATGLVIPRRSAPDLLTNPAYRTTCIAFVAVPEGSGAIGSTGGTWSQSDEHAGTATSGRTFVSAFEVTQEQWRRLAGTTPWLDVRPTSLAGTAYDPHAPAYGISLDAARSAIASASGRYPGSFALPTAALWERACRGGSGALYAWGDQHDAATTAAYAVVEDTNGGVRGPARVGARQANAYGLYDMHGNVWELTEDAEVRGGSWRDGVALARSANRIALDPSTPHALVGVRLVYRPEGP